MSAQKMSPPLQPGAVLLPEVKEVHVGTLIPQKVDATLDLHGVTWLRVHGGFGGHFDREDWIADVVAVSITVCDYHWKRSDFGPSYGTFENACHERLKWGLDKARRDKAELEAKLASLSAVIARLEHALLDDAPAEPLAADPDEAFSGRRSS